MAICRVLFEAQQNWWEHFEVGSAVRAVIQVRQAIVDFKARTLPSHNNTL